MDAVFMKDRLDDVIRKASELGYDVVNIKDTGQWVNSNGENIYDEATGLSGKDDYFILNKNAIDIQGLPVQKDKITFEEAKKKLKPAILEFEVPKSWWDEKLSGGYARKFIEKGEYWVAEGIPKEFLKKS